MPMDLALSVVGLTILVVGCVIDIRHRRLPDEVTVGLAILGLAWSAMEGGWPQLAWHVLGMGIGFVAFWTIGEVYFRLSGVDGLGLGDAKLLGAIGAWLGPALLPAVVFVAAATALVFVYALLPRGEARLAKSTVAFGPFLGLGFVGCWSARLAGLV